MKIWILDLGAIAGGIICVIFSAFVIPYVMRHHRLWKEHSAMIQRTLKNNTGVMIFGYFGKWVQSEFLGDFLTSLFGEVLFDLITEWNKWPAHMDAIVTPTDEAHAASMRYLAGAKASSFILQSHGLGRYFHNAELHGPPEYRFCKVIVAIACPKPNRLSSHDHPRLIAIEEGALMRIADDHEAKPQSDDQNGNTWLSVLRELAADWREGRHNGIQVLEIPVDLPDTQNPANLSLSPAAESAGHTSNPESVLTV